jgi:Zn-finger nucleic acid-binding protein
MTLFDQPATEIKLTPCPRCHSEHVWKGEIYAHSYWPVFKPGRVRRWHSFFNPGITMPKAAISCLDCGLVWTDAPPEELRKIIQKHCEQTDNKSVV